VPKKRVPLLHLPRALHVLKLVPNRVLSAHRVSLTAHPAAV
jgi:hypothetical protein